MFYELPANPLSNGLFLRQICFLCVFFGNWGFGDPKFPTKNEGKLTKSGIPGWFLNKIGYLFFRGGARLRTYAKRLQNAFWCLNPLRLVCAQQPKPFFRCSTPQNSANDGAQKVLSTNNPILFRKTPGIPCPVLRFYKQPDFVHTAPDFVHTAPDFVQFCKTRGDTETDISPQPSTEDLSHNWQVADCDDCDAAAAALLTSGPQRSAATDEQLAAPMKPHCEAWLHGRR